MSSSPPIGTPRGGKRARSPSRVPVEATPTTNRLQRRASGSSLPPSSPPAQFLDTDDISDQDAVQDLDDDAEGEDDEGEDLFGDTLIEYVAVSLFSPGQAPLT